MLRRENLKVLIPLILYHLMDLSSGIIPDPNTCIMDLVRLPLHVHVLSMKQSISKALYVDVLITGPDIYIGDGTVTTLPHLRPPMYIPE